MNGTDYSKHLTDEEIIKYLETRNDVENIDHEEFHSEVEAHLFKCELCTKVVKKMFMVEKLIDKFIENPVGYLKAWEIWKKEKRKKYQERVVNKLSGLLHRISDEDPFLKERLEKWIELRKKAIVEKVDFLTIYPEFDWKFEYDSFKINGIKGEDLPKNFYTISDEPARKDTCNITLKFSNFQGWDLIGSDYWWTPPLTFLVPKSDHIEPMITIPHFAYNKTVWISEFSNVPPGVYVLLPEIGAEPVGKLQKSVTVW